MPPLWEKKDESVNLDAVEPILQDQFDGIAQVRKAALQSLLDKPLIFTSGNDGKHMTTSLHYRGLAVDVRTREYTDMLAKLLRAFLGPDYDVVIESDHVHIEMDVK